jgi:hypothetical protein
VMAPVDSALILKLPQCLTKHYAIKTHGGWIYRSMKNVVFWDVTPCGCCKNQLFRGTYRLNNQGEKNQRARKSVSSNYQPKHATANAVPSSLILFTLMIQAIRPSETSVLTRGTWHKIPEDDILHSHRRENLKSYIALTGWTL